MAITSAGYSVTMRLYIAPDDQRAIGRIATAIGEAGGTVTALDIVESEAARLVVDLTANARDSDHTAELSEAVDALPGVTVRNVSDRTFLLHLGGKLEVRLKVPLRTRAQLSMAYTPGVARVSMELARRPEAARNLTVKGNAVAIVTDGSAVLGLGDIGPVAALPVMEGKAALLKRFAGVDGWPICLDSSDTDEIVRAVEMMAPGFGAVNLEDISAPRCFDIEERLRASLDIPVFHDDQHGTSIVTLAALTNALKVVGKEMAGLRVAISGAGAAGVAVKEAIAKVSLVGAGMKTSPGVAARMFRALSDSGINIEMISTSTIRISCVVSREDAEAAVRALHGEFEPPLITEETGADG